MKILFLTQYYPPEVGAPQNRLSELAERFQRAGHQVEVLTAMPNYPVMRIFEDYRGAWYRKESVRGITVHRTAIFVKNSRSLILRMLTYFSFVFSSFLGGIFYVQRPDLIICESPPLFLGMTALALKWLRRTRLLLNVSDLWPESAEKLGLVTNRFFLSWSYRLESLLYRNADLISGQTQGIVQSISARHPDKRVFWLKNGVDLSFYRPETDGSTWRGKIGFPSGEFIVFYGGILGHAQGLEVILEAASRLREETAIRFVLAGDGPLKRDLIERARQMALQNVTFLDPYPKMEMPEVIAGIDAAVVPLRRLELFRGAIPSKIFESLAMKKPILLGVEGEAWDLFIRDGRCGVAFTPENPEELAGAVQLLFRNKEIYRAFAENAYFYVSEHFNRETIFIEFQQFITDNLFSSAT